MAYAIAQPPFTLRFKSMSRRELQHYYEWHFGVMPGRIAELSAAVACADGSETWSPDETPGSLVPLGLWFADQVQTRPRTPDELSDLGSKSEFDIAIRGSELTNRTFSLAMDVGMYLGLVMVRRHPGLKWHQPLDDPAFVDYGRPVLRGFGPAPFNPVRIVVTMAYGVASGERTGHRLKDIYDYWAERAAIAGQRRGV